MKFVYSFITAFVLFSLCSVQINGQNDDKDKVYVQVDEMPKFPGGEEAFGKYISEHVNYPEIAQKNDIQGKVFVTFHILKDGSVTNAKVVRGVDPSLDKEALRVIKSMPNWEPGKQKGEPVNVEFTVPIAFKLDDGKTKKVDTEKINGSGEDEPVFYIVEDMPKFPGGEDAFKKYITDHIKYPEVAKEKGIQGKVFISFIVTKDGSVQDAKVIRGVDPSLDKEALRVVKGLPNFKPGKQRGQAVNVKYTIPVNFELGVQPLKEELKR